MTDLDKALELARAVTRMVHRRDEHARAHERMARRLPGEGHRDAHGGDMRRERARARKVEARMTRSATHTRRNAGGWR